MLKVLKYKLNNVFRKKISLFLVFIFVINIFYINCVNGASNNGFKSYKIEKVNYNIPYEVIKNSDNTKTYVVYNFEGDLYDTEDGYNAPVQETPKTPFDIIKEEEKKEKEKGKEKIASSSILYENNYLLYDDFRESLSTTSIIYYSTFSEVLRYNVDELQIKNIKDLVENKYYPMTIAKKPYLRIPKDVIESMKKYDILIIFNSDRAHMNLNNYMKFRYIEDVMVNRSNNQDIETRDKRRVKSIYHDYFPNHSDITLMKFEYMQKDKKDGYAYIDIGYTLDKEDFDDVSNLGYRIFSDEWETSYDDGRTDFFLRKDVTYVINVLKKSFVKKQLAEGVYIKKLKINEDGYADKYDFKWSTTYKMLK